MKNVIVVANFFMGREDVSGTQFVEFISNHQDKIESIYYDGDFYSVENTLKNLKTN